MYLHTSDIYVNEGVHCTALEALGSESRLHAIDAVLHLDLPLDHLRNHCTRHRHKHVSQTAEDGLRSTPMRAETVPHRARCCRSRRAARAPPPSRTSPPQHPSPWPDDRCGRAGSRPSALATAPPRHARHARRHASGRDRASRRGVSCVGVAGRSHCCRRAAARGGGHRRSLTTGSRRPDSAIQQTL